MKKAALIGLGMVASVYGDAFRNSKRVGLARVYSRTRASQDTFCAKWPDLRAAPSHDLDEVLADDVIDFVVLTTPPDQRRDIVERVAAAGKPILMEKPVERNLANATELVEICESQGVPLGIVLQHRARQEVADLRALGAQLGGLRCVEVTVPWWRPQSYYDQPGRGTYARDGGGVLISQAIHTLDLMLSLTGPASSVTAMCATTGFHQMEAEDFVSAGLTFANGAVGHIMASTASYPGRGEVITLHHENGSASLAAGKLTVDWQDGRRAIIGEAAASGAGHDPMAFSSQWHQAMIEDFSDAITDGRPPLVTGRDALDVHRLITALETSAKTGTRISQKDV